MDNFIVEHSQRYEFREMNCAPAQDRYAQIFQALQRELCWMPRPIVRPRALRVLQCLRLLTRDPQLQLIFFEGSTPSACSSQRTVAKLSERGENEREAERSYPV